jgi:hypothetical protein
VLDLVQPGTETPWAWAQHNTRWASAKVEQALQTVHVDPCFYFFLFGGFTFKFVVLPSFIFIFLILDELLLVFAMFYNF